jgi:ribosomal protein L21E
MKDNRKFFELGRTETGESEQQHPRKVRDFPLQNSLPTFSTAARLQCIISPAIAVKSPTLHFDSLLGNYIFSSPAFYSNFTA